MPRAILSLCPTVVDVDSVIGTVEDALVVSVVVVLPGDTLLIWYIWFALWLVGRLSGNVNSPEFLPLHQVAWAAPRFLAVPCHFHPLLTLTWNTLLFFSLLGCSSN